MAAFKLKPPAGPTEGAIQSDFMKLLARQSWAVHMKIPKPRTPKGVKRTAAVRRQQEALRVAEYEKLCDRIEGLDVCLAFWRQNTGSAMISSPGSDRSRFVEFGLWGQSDIDGTIKPGGRKFCVEVKGPEGKLSPNQIANARAVRACGGVYLLVRDPVQGVRDVHQALQKVTGSDLPLVGA